MKAGRWQPLLYRWLKFSAVGWLGVGVQLCMLTLLAGHLELHYLPATALAVESAIVHNFFWHERWTWGDRGFRGRPGRLLRLVRFNVASGAVSLMGNLGFMSLFVGQLGLHYLVGNVASIASCAILNFVISDRLVFLAMTKRASAFSMRAPVPVPVPVPVTGTSGGGVVPRSGSEAESPDASRTNSS